jgi:hypothetical protein
MFLLQCGGYFSPGDLVISQYDDDLIDKGLQCGLEVLYFDTCIGGSSEKDKIE